MVILLKEQTAVLTQLLAKQADGDETLKLLKTIMATGKKQVQLNGGVAPP
jgi:hypothetical protein